jgi:hypothetical protein
MLFLLESKLAEGAVEWKYVHVVKIRGRGEGKGKSEAHTVTGQALRNPRSGFRRVKKDVCGVKIQEAEKRKGKREKGKGEAKAFNTEVTEKGWRARRRWRRRLAVASL